MDKTEDSLDAEKIARGERARLLRDTLRLSRPDCARKFHIPIGSLQNWEDARHGGLTRNGAKRLVAAYEQEGLICSIEWLLEGTGAKPTFSHRAMAVVSEPGEPLSKMNHPNQAIHQELLLFHKHNENTIDAIIPDDLLSPYLMKGDVVAGVRYFGDEIRNAVGSICIVQTVTGETRIGYLHLENNDNRYILFNGNREPKTIIKSDIELFSAAPVLWLRRAK